MVNLHSFHHRIGSCPDSAKGNTQRERDNRHEKNEDGRDQSHGTLLSVVARAMRRLTRVTDRWCGALGEANYTQELLE
ncbi:MAG: Uncharacterised protein [Cellulomonadaceae bacterium TMED98]|nr:MAG: Uncharacterised protein [Cellulomonadaceae bacterium TMED98]